MDKEKLQSMTKDELIELLIRREKYNKTLQTAIRHYAMSLLQELNKIKNQENYD